MNYPSALKFKKARMASNSPTVATQSKALIQHVRRTPAHRWEATLTTVPIHKSKARQVASWMFSLNGRAGTVDLPFPTYSNPQGRALGDVTVRATANAGSNNVALGGFAGGVLVQLCAGDFVRFANHSKVYQVTHDVSSSVSGQLTVSLYPQLTSHVPAGVAVIVREVPFRVRLARDIQEFTQSVADAGFVVFELDVVEAL